MKDQTIDFSLSDAGRKEFAGNGTRQDIAVDGSVNVIVNVNGVDKTVGTVTDTAENLYISRPFALVATGGAAVGDVTSIHEGGP